LQDQKECTVKFEDLELHAVGNFMNITEVKIYPANEGKLKAYATMVFDNCFIVRDLKIIKSDKGYFVSMPSRRKKDGSFKDIVHPLNSETRTLIEERLIEEYKKSVDENAVLADSESTEVDEETKE
jgi:stage V sporulation protein G